MVWDTVTRKYYFIFSPLSKFEFSFCRPSNSEMKQETNVIAIVTYLNYVALKWCMTSPSYINRLFVPSPLFSGLDFD